MGSGLAYTIAEELGVDPATRSVLVGMVRVGRQAKETTDQIEAALRAAVEISQRYDNPYDALLVMHEALGLYMRRRHNPPFHAGSFGELALAESAAAMESDHLLPQGLQDRVDEYLLGITNEHGNPGYHPTPPEDHTPDVHLAERILDAHRPDL